MSLDEVQSALEPLLMGLGHVRIERTVLASVPRLVVVSAPPSSAHRSVRITPVQAPDTPWDYEVLWSVYRSADPQDDRDGRTGGDADLVRRVVQRWIVDHAAFNEIAEFRG